MFIFLKGLIPRKTKTEQSNRKMDYLLNNLVLDSEHIDRFVGEFIDNLCFRMCMREEDEDYKRAMRHILHREIRTFLPGYINKVRRNQEIANMYSSEVSKM